MLSALINTMSVLLVILMSEVSQFEIESGNNGSLDIEIQKQFKDLSRQWTEYLIHPKRFFFFRFLTISNFNPKSSTHFPMLSAAEGSESTSIRERVNLN